MPDTIISRALLAMCRAMTAAMKGDREAAARAALDFTDAVLDLADSRNRRDPP